MEFGVSAIPLAPLLHFVIPYNQQ